MKARRISEVPARIVLSAHAVQRCGRLGRRPRVVLRQARDGLRTMLRLGRARPGPGGDVAVLVEGGGVVICQMRADVGGWIIKTVLPPEGRLRRQAVNT